MIFTQGNYTGVLRDNVAHLLAFESFELLMSRKATMKTKQAPVISSGYSGKTNNKITAIAPESELKSDRWKRAGEEGHWHSDWKRSLMVTELFIKSPLPEINGMGEKKGGGVNKGRGGKWGDSQTGPLGALSTETWGEQRGTRWHRSHEVGMKITKVHCCRPTFIHTQDALKGLHDNLAGREMYFFFFQRSSESALSCFQYKQ